MNLEKIIKSFVVVPSSRKAPSGEVLLTFFGKGWAIVSNGASLSRQLDFEYSPSPSKRDNDFYKRCRFDNPIDALILFEKYLKTSNDQLSNYYVENYNKDLRYFIQKIDMSLN